MKSNTTYLNTPKSLPLFLLIIFFSLVGMTSIEANQRIDDASLLSVRFVKFDLTVTPNSQVHITWKTSAEVNSETYEVLRSEDLDTWEVLGNVAATGDVYSVNDYQFYDKRPLRGVNYYKIRHTGSDGEVIETDFRDIVALVDMLQMAVSPNPITDNRTNVELSVEESIENAKINIFNKVGQLVANKTCQGFERSFSMNVSALETGFYIVEISSQTSRSVEMLVIK